MKNKRSLKIMILAALTAVVTLLCSSCGKKEPNYTGRVKTFAPGTHIVSTSENGRLYKDNHQLEYKPGYEIISVNVSDHSRIYVAVYQNVVDVECVETENGYTEFGIPVEKEMTLQKEE